MQSGGFESYKTLSSDFSAQILDVTSEGVVYLHPSQGLVYANAAAKGFFRECEPESFERELREFAFAPDETVRRISIQSQSEFQKSFRLFRIETAVAADRLIRESVGVRIIDYTEYDDMREFKRALLAHLAHEVRTPLASLTLSTRLLAKSAQSLDNPLLRASAETTVIDVDRLRNLVEEVLSISRFSFETRQIRRTTEDLKELLLLVKTPLKKRFQYKKLRIRCGESLESSSSVLIQCEKSQLLWGLSNLLSVIAERAQEDSEILIEKQGAATLVFSLGLKNFKEDHQFGVAIARRVALEHGGELTFSPGAAGQGSYRFTLNLDSIASRPLSTS